MSLHCKWTDMETFILKKNNIKLNIVWHFMEIPYGFLKIPLCQNARKFGRQNGLSMSLSSCYY